MFLYKDQQATNTIFLACSKLSERPSKTTTYFDLYFYFEVKWPQKGCEWDCEQGTGCHKVIYQYQEIIIRLTKVFSNLALTFFQTMFCKWNIEI